MTKELESLQTTIEDLKYQYKFINACSSISIKTKIFPYFSKQSRSFKKDQNKKNKKMKNIICLL